MKRASVHDGDGPTDSARLSVAADWFCRLHSDDAIEEDLSRFKIWLERDADNAAAYRKVCASWARVGEYASTPQVMAARRDALGFRPDAIDGLSRGRFGQLRLLRQLRSRWVLVAAVLVVAISLTFLASSQWGWRADVYSTGARERRTLTLADGSAVTLDTGSRMRVRYARTQRLITLEQGQACFQVAKDPSRPFRISARTETIVALGTQLNVDLIDRGVTIAMIEGHVAVLPGKTSRDRPPLELQTGEALRVQQDGSTTFLPRINVDHMVAWLRGYLAFDNEPLGRAADRVSHYAQQRIKVSPSVAAIGISGVFNIGDANAFVDAVTAYFPVQAIRTDASTVYLVRRSPGNSAG